jgi:tetratricopeptide (TPR) repeat protein
MTSTRWIAVAWILIASPVFAQVVDAPATDVAATPRNVLSFEEELEGLRRDIAATKTLREQAAVEAGQAIESETLATQQRNELLELLTKLATQKPSPQPAPTPDNTAPRAVPSTLKTTTRKPATESDSAAAHPLITDKVVDPYGLGRALFRTGDYRGAEQAFRKVKVTDDNRVMLQYLIATCLRKQSKWEQAVKAYRVVAENNDDPVLRDMATWQLENIRWHQRTESQLEQLRELRGSSNDSNTATQNAKSPR